MAVVNHSCLMCKNSVLELSEVCILKCNHIFCWQCLEGYLCENLNSKVKCPNDDCKIFISDANIRKTLPAIRISDYESLCFPRESDTLFHCLLAECDYVVYHETDSIQFECQRCSLFNCIKCKGVHPFLSCAKYQLEKETPQCRQMESEEKKKALEHLKKIEYDTLYQSIRSMETDDLVTNQEVFKCSICETILPKGAGIILRNCFDKFCRPCLHDSVKNAEGIPIKCPGDGCHGRLQDREIRGILTEGEYKIHFNKSNDMAKSKIENVVQCKKPDCPFFAIVDNVKYSNFKCPVCQSVNCLKCNIIHKNRESCEQFAMRNTSESSPDYKNMAFINAEIESGKSMLCQCGAVINKRGGCNWIQCPQCKLELCWILKMPRWGPKGPGDISGGCRCGVDNIPCDPKCFFGCIPEH